jgi:hypothetical protein
LPRWADTVTADKTRVSSPNGGKRDVGFAGGESPAAQFLNWLFNLIYQWLGWAEESIDDLEAADVALDGRLDTAEASLVDWDERLDRLEARGHNHVIVLPGTAFTWSPTDADITWQEDGPKVSDSAGTLILPIPKPVWDTGADGETSSWKLSAVRVVVDVTSKGTFGVNMVCRTYTLNGDGSLNVTGTAGTTESSLADSYLEITDINTALTGVTGYDKFFQIRISFSGGTGGDFVTVRSAEIVYTRT